MEPKIYPIINASAPLKALIGSDPVRFFPWGQAPQNTEYPYVTYGSNGASPENYLDRVPDVDNISTQIDVWADKGSDCLQVATLIRDLIEPHGHMIGFGNTERDQETQAYRIRLQFDLFTFR